MGGLMDVKKGILLVVLGMGAMFAWEAAETLSPAEVPVDAPGVALEGVSPGGSTVKAPIAPDAVGS